LSAPSLHAAQRSPFSPSFREPDSLCFPCSSLITREDSVFGFLRNMVFPGLVPTSVLPESCFFSTTLSLISLKPRPVARLRDVFPSGVPFYTHFQPPRPFGRSFRVHPVLFLWRVGRWAFFPCFRNCFFFRGPSLVLGSRGCARLLLFLPAVALAYGPAKTFSCFLSPRSSFCLQKFASASPGFKALQFRFIPA